MEAIVGKHGPSSYTIYSGKHSLHHLDQFLKENYRDVKKFILVDEHSHKLCLPLLDEADVTELSDAVVIEIESGESHKTMDCCMEIWRALIDHGADRHSLLINLGGGVISDMGGFVASTYKRGIDFINIPTTLLSMIDAAYGGKLGVDLDGLKNQIGLFGTPKAVFVNSFFLNTLDERHMRSGFAEGLKHALIWDKMYWELLQEKDVYNPKNWSSFITLSIRIKNMIVLKDPYEKGVRKLLNFGHTIGHALESAALEKDPALLHGEAVAIGMLCEAFLSYLKTGLSEDELSQITRYICEHFKPYDIGQFEKDDLIKLMYSDKKNVDGTIRFSLLTAIGEGKADVEIGEDDIKKALEYYTEHVIAV